MTQPKDPKGFLVVLPGEIIEIPQDSDKSWLTLFCGRSSLSGSFVTLCLSGLCGIAIRGAHGSSSK